MIVPGATLSHTDVAAHYDDLDVFYRAIWGEHLHHGLWETGRESKAEAVEKLALRVAQEAGVRSGAEICDIGTGYGATARLLAERLGARVTGLTVSAAQHAYAQTRSAGADNPRYLLRDWMDNGLPANSFDGCIAIESSEHMDDLARFFSESRRVLRPGGRLVVCAWLAKTGADGRVVRHLLEPICREGRLRGMGDEDDYRRLLAATGFDLVRFADVSARVQRTWTLSAWGMLRHAATHPRALEFLISAARNRIFALTVLRIGLAYRLGAMRYGIFTAVAR